MSVTVTGISSVIGYPKLIVREACGFAAYERHMMDLLRRGLDKKALYAVYNIRTDLDIRQFGDLINTVSPVHIRQGSQLHNVMSMFVKMPGEQEAFLVPGAVLMRAGIQLSPAYAGTGFNERTRCFQDFSSRLYFLEAQEAAD